MKKCEICGKTLKKTSRKICYGCRCTQYFAKNGENTAKTRVGKAIKHLNENKDKVILKTIFGL